MNHSDLFLLQPATVLILRTTAMLILANAFVPLTLGDQNVNSVKKITGDFLLNLAARYSRLLKRICLIPESQLDSGEPQSLFSVSKSWCNVLMLKKKNQIVKCSLRNLRRKLTMKIAIRVFSEFWIGAQVVLKCLF